MSEFLTSYPNYTILRFAKEEAEVQKNCATFKVIRSKLRFTKEEAESRK